ncbi:MAG: glucose-1-phosphate thymidylyltransferase [Candidatus Altiarchaeum hamiconexum]|uniref:Glucose-1-phosphate thymidylyltransferase n=1 Tax=Candidatus Altarchaeum hamiconexum TaxID=1803513 RepID=A0A8J7YR99_9ARCH|nr:glucose-1-phosphate thymidylyltransferase [Candidatus Altarchaeum hamiconexum]OIQ04802.1 MAG: glucose-1-phosphate thymidylyltransferase [Candidatus Altarchaeum sp. CG2_30_32_3053]PIN67433.1 MAG: glucose-1-phosphate thymidylyltransferase [Candidatus Altarchaeum sp. CG12_big_fil_rev_8_21_14_0_65_33_22]PIV27756.1 MAG: glucose-1-phosphate thymidylyltransferase [Candidatus Altarchaeum sp. CG03_land_8_20_14_0_80_32_618]PIX48300.1 MAG: glucose-1-phosphate thymidylyltransferase [Candidatus Altarchae
MKGLILSGGEGTRLRPLTYSQQKQLIPVANKPVLFYGIEDLIEAGIKDIGIIVGPNKEQIENAVNDAKFDAKFTFINQHKPEGLAHAVKIAKKFINDESFVMYLGDNILMQSLNDFINGFEESDESARILLCKVSDPSRYGVAKLNDNGEVIKLVEKPKEFISDLALIGVYAFKNKIFDACDAIKPSWRNELEITDAIQWLINNKFKVPARITKGWWKDTGKAEDMIDANRLILDSLKGQNLGKIENTRIEGRVFIDKDSKILNSTIRGPVIIGKNCEINEAYIGPYTSIGNFCKLKNCEIDNSIVLDKAEISEIRKIYDSLIGKEVKIFKKQTIPKGKKFVVGDRSVLEI